MRRNKIEYDHTQMASVRATEYRRLLANTFYKIANRKIVIAYSAQQPAIIKSIMVSKKTKKGEKNRYQNGK